MGQVLSGTRQADSPAAIGERVVERRPRRPGVRHRHQHYDPADRQRVSAHLPALMFCIKLRKSMFIAVRVFVFALLMAGTGAAGEFNEVLSIGDAAPEWK